MRHQKSGRKLNMNDSHRDAMFRNMAASLFRHRRIETTDARAKELRGFAENPQEKRHENAPPPTGGTATMREEQRSRAKERESTAGLRQNR